MIAAKHTDTIVGMDMHMIQPPPPAAPVMVPHPVVGMILDPADYQTDACTVFVNGLPRARAGSVCVMTPPHIPIGGVFVMPVLSEAEVAEGSSTVVADGEAMSASTHQVSTCHDNGAPAPARAWKSAPAKSLLKAGSVVVAVPAGGLVNVGGAPTTGATHTPEESAPLDWLELRFVNEADGSPCAEVTYVVELSDGRVRNGTTNDTGTVVLHGIPAGACAVSLRGYIASVACPSASVGSSPAAIERRVRVHEDMLDIAAEYAIGDQWKDVFNHADNQALRDTRPDPLELEPGDVVVLPAALLPRFELQSGQVHEFQVRPQTRRMRVYLQRTSGEPFDSCEWRASFGPREPEQRGVTDAAGLVELDVPWRARRASVLVEARRTLDDDVVWQSFTLALAHLG
ncbi:MAG: PAAR domain-containing protein, partial [Polyangiales bacterium]